MLRKGTSCWFSPSPCGTAHAEAHRSPPAPEAPECWGWEANDLSAGWLWWTGGHARQRCLVPMTESRAVAP